MYRSIALKCCNNSTWLTHERVLKSVVEDEAIAKTSSEPTLGPFIVVDIGKVPPDPGRGLPLRMRAQAMRRARRKDERKAATPEPGSHLLTTLCIELGLEALAHG